MKYITLILLVVLLQGCHEGLRKEKNTDYQLDMKYCMSSCMDYEFKKFHNGQSFGGSSSMDGLAETKIYQRVEMFCKNFYKDETCCKWNHKYLDRNQTIKTWVHGNKFGACKEDNWEGWLK